MTFDLKELGWDDRWAAVFAPFAADGLVPARVAIEFNHIFRLYAEAGELQAQHSGRLLHEAESKEQLSAVGDWIAARPSIGEATATIEAVLPRRSRFSRKVAGELTEEQAREATVRATRRFARRQDAWFRKDERVVWLPADAPDLVERAVALVAP